LIETNKTNRDAWVGGLLIVQRSFADLAWSMNPIMLILWLTSLYMPRSLPLQEITISPLPILS
jgi:hypothetical protein